MKHHYIPVFYLKRWAGADGRVCVYSAPHRDKVIASRVHPSGTGYSKNIYKLPGLPEDQAHSFEKSFLSPVDSAAADALKRIYGERPGDWTLAEKSSWTRFVTSLLFCDPSSVDLLTKRMRTDYFKTDAESEARYAKGREPGQPPTLRFPAIIPITPGCQMCPEIVVETPEIEVTPEMLEAGANLLAS